MKRPALVWGGLVVALLALDVAVQGTMLLFALADPSFAVEPDYEWKAEHWDEVQRERSRSTALGWSVGLRTAPAAEPGRIEVELEVADPTGAPVAGAEVELAAFHNARASRVLAVRLRPVGGGRYAEALALSRPGVWEFQVAIVRGAERYVGRFRESVP